MKQGKSLTELAVEIERQEEAKRDYLASTAGLSFEVIDNVLKLSLGTPGSFDICDTAHRQIAERLQIPQRYYDRLKVERPALLAQNVNRRFRARNEKRLVRVLDGGVRAFLSDRYQRIDNHDVASVVLPVLSTIPGIHTVSSEITESRLYIKAVTSERRAEVQSRRVGDIVEAGVMISNSEIGLGALSVKPFAFFLWCLNGAVRDGAGYRAAHLGRKQEADELAALLPDHSKRLEDRATLAKLRNVVRAAFDEAKFRAWIDRLNEATKEPIKKDLVKAVETTAQLLQLRESESSEVLRHLIEGGDLSRYGLMQAVTRSANDVESYDRATELESLGASVIDLPQSQWREIAAV